RLYTHTTKQRDKHTYTVQMGSYSDRLSCRQFSRTHTVTMHPHTHGQTHPHTQLGSRAGSSHVTNSLSSVSSSPMDMAGMSIHRLSCLGSAITSGDNFA